MFKRYCSKPHSLSMLPLTSLIQNWENHPPLSWPTPLWTSTPPQTGLKTSLEMLLPPIDQLFQMPSLRPWTSLIMKLTKSLILIAPPITMSTSLGTDITFPTVQSPPELPQSTPPKTTLSQMQQIKPISRMIPALWTIPDISTLQTTPLLLPLMPMPPPSPNKQLQRMPWKFRKTLLQLLSRKLLHLWLRNDHCKSRKNK